VSSSTGAIMLKPSLVPGSLAKIFTSVKETRRLTLSDRYGLMTAILDESLDLEDRLYIDRLLQAVQTSRISILNE
jgi:hypothetical protein